MVRRSRRRAVARPAPDESPANMIREAGIAEWNASGGG